jgi:ribose-phosphate pyrophosphokinase
VTQIADQLKIDFAIINRERYHVKPGENEEMETKISLVGDVKDKVCLMLVFSG